MTFGGGRHDQIYFLCFYIISRALVLINLGIRTDIDSLLATLVDFRHSKIMGVRKPMKSQMKTPYLND